MRRLPLSMTRTLAICIRPVFTAGWSRLEHAFVICSRILSRTESRQGSIRGSLASRTPCCEKPQGTDEPCATYNEDCDGPDPFQAEVDQGARWLSPSSPNSHDVTASANPRMPTPQGLKVSTRMLYRLTPRNQCPDGPRTPLRLLGRPSTSSELKRPSPEWRKNQARDAQKHISSHVESALTKKPGEIRLTTKKSVA
jgi:hypothetical protein